MLMQERDVPADQYMWMLLAAWKLALGWGLLVILKRRWGFGSEWEERRGCYGGWFGLRLKVDEAAFTVGPVGGHAFTGLVGRVCCQPDYHVH